NGTIGYVTNDVGIVSVGKHHLVVSAYTLMANSNVTTEQAEELIGRLARAAYSYFEDTTRQTNANEYTLSIYKQKGMLCKGSYENRRNHTSRIREAAQ